MPGWAWLLLVPAGVAGCWWGLHANGQCNYIAGDVRGPLGVLATGMGLLAFFGVCVLLRRVRLPLVEHVARATIVVMCLHQPLVPLLNALLHYQGGMACTLTGDILMVLLLTAAYPFIARRLPALTGGRR